MHKATAIEEESQLLRMTSSQRAQSAAQQLATLHAEYRPRRARGLAARRSLARHKRRALCVRTDALAQSRQWSRRLIEVDKPAPL